MPNQSYCRFRNTLNDLRDCVDSLEMGDDLSDEEQVASERMYEVCKKYIELYDRRK